LYSFTRDLLPPGSRFVISHDEILVIYSGKMKCKFLPVHDGLPHNARVAKRSVSSRYRHPSDDILDNMMIPHLPDRKSDRIAVNVYG
jgi:hypothetical protein